MADDSILDPAVFLSIDFTSSTKTLEIYARDNREEDVYDLKVTAFYRNPVHWRAKAFAFFSIDVKACNSATLNADTYIWKDDSYSILDDPKTLNWTP